jgi:peptidyl-prolyl cis-trans isomerase SurA
MQISPAVRSSARFRALAGSGAVVLVSLASACSARPGEPTPPSADAWAVVDGREITGTDVDKAYRRAMQANAAPSQEEEFTAKLELLNEMIVQDLLLAKARELKIEVTDAELDTAFSNARKDIPEEAFQQELKSRQLSPTDMRDGLRNELLTQKVLDREVVAKVSVTDQEVSSFFEANKAQFNVPEDAVHMAQIVVTAGRERVTNRTGDDATTPEMANRKAQMLMERLKGGAPFADLARDFSEDPDSAPRGGDLGLVPVSRIRQAPPQLRDAVLKSEPGAVHTINSGGVLQIVLVVAKEAAGQRDLSTPVVREGITSTLRGRREQLLRTAFLSALRSDARVTNLVARRVIATPGTLPTFGPQAPGTR